MHVVSLPPRTITITITITARMLVNTFIDKMLTVLSYTNARLECAITRLHIQTEMQNREAFSLINYFIMLIPEYKYHWNRIDARETIEFPYQISGIIQFQELQMYMIVNELLTPGEAMWLEDTIHQILTNDSQEDT